MYSPSLYSNPRFSQSKSAVPGDLVVEISGAATIRSASPRGWLSAAPAGAYRRGCLEDDDDTPFAHGNREEALAAGPDTKLQAGVKESTTQARQIDGVGFILPELCCVEMVI